MRKRNLDRLFEEKLSRHEVGVSSDSWSHVSKELDAKPGLPLLRVAAAVTFLVLSGLVVWKMSLTTPSADFQGVAGAADHPDVREWALKDIPEIQTNLMTGEKGDHEVKKRKSDQYEVRQAPATQPQVKSNELAMNATQMTPPEAIDPVQFDLSDSIVLSNELIRSEEIHTGGGIQIIYFSRADSSELEPTGFRRLIAIARDIDPGEMWASLRETKDDFLNINGNQNSK